jgi:hypothetical protein
MSWWAQSRTDGWVLYLRLSPRAVGDEPRQGLLQQLQKLPQLVGHPLEFGSISATGV